MKCYTSTTRQVQSGIELITDPKLGLVVYLGEDGRGRRYEKIGLGRRNPPNVASNPTRVFECQIAVIETTSKKDGKEFSFVILERDDPRDKRFLVRINTSGCYTKCSIGSWKEIKGTTKDVIKGYGAHGIAGRIGNWDDGLTIMDPGSVIRVKPEGGYKTDPYYLIHAGETLERMNEADYTASQCLCEETTATQL